MSSCIKCFQVPDDILDLDCLHALCIPCAASLLNKGNKIKCPSCQQNTRLKPSHLQELIRMQSLSQSFLSNQKSSGSIETQDEGLKNSGSVCRSHPNLDANYFCFSCLTSCICSECVVYGSHKSHKIENINQASEVILNKLQDQLVSIQNFTRQIEEFKQNMQNQLIQQDYFFDKVLAKKTMIFQSIRTWLDKEEKSIDVNYQLIKESIKKEINSFQINTDSLQHASDKLLQEFKQVTKNPQQKIGLLNFYSSHLDSESFLEELVMKFNQIDQQQQITSEHTKNIQQKLYLQLDHIPETLQTVYLKLI